MKGNHSHFESGQSLVLIALLLIAFVAMLALVVDGGFSYANRRAAQNAADAGALAGAEALCKDLSDTDVEKQAREYATVHNHATSADVSIDHTDYSVKVTATVGYQTFFASLLGFDEVSARAEATAGCFQGCGGVGILPVAWACKPYGDNPATTDACNVNFGPPETDEDVYIIMDTSKVCVKDVVTGEYVDAEDKNSTTCNPLAGDIICQDPPNSGNPPGAIDCDYDDDNKNDVLSGGQRSWLNLSGGSPDANDLRDWIINGFEEYLEVHTWIGGSGGTMGSVWHAVRDNMPGKTVFLPIYDQLYTKGDPEESEFWHDYDNDTVHSSDSQIYFHIIQFSGFKVTCVDENEKGYQQPGINTIDICPGKKALIDEILAQEDLTESLKDKITKTLMKTNMIEGYFVKDYNPQISGACNPGIGMGSYTVYLKP